MIDLIKEKVKNIDKQTKVLMKNGLKICFLLFILSTIVFLTYDLFYNSPDLYYIGLSIFQMGITFTVAFLCCGFIFSEIKTN